MLELFSSGYNGTKLKSRLKLSAGRLQMESNKKTALMKQNMRNIAEILSESPPKEEQARLITQALIRDDRTILAYDILRFECLLLAERFQIIEQSQECPPDLASAISDLIYASSMINIHDLISVRRQFRRKYGKSFRRNAINNIDNILNEKVVANLTNKPLPKELVDIYMEKICKQHKVDWSPTIELMEKDIIQSPTSLPEIAATTGLEQCDQNDIIIPLNGRLANLEVMLPPFKPDFEWDTFSMSSQSSTSPGLYPRMHVAEQLAKAVPCYSLDGKFLGQTVDTTPCY